MLPARRLGKYVFTPPLVRVLNDAPLLLAPSWDSAAMLSRTRVGVSFSLSVDAVGS
jgi:hypothetical protein